MTLCFAEHSERKGEHTWMACLNIRKLTSVERIQLPTTEMYSTVL